MGRLVWFGIVALSPASAVVAVAGLVMAGAAVGYAVSETKKPKTTWPF